MDEELSDRAKEMSAKKWLLFVTCFFILCMTIQGENIQRVESKVDVMEYDIKNLRRAIIVVDKELSEHKNKPLNVADHKHHLFSGKVAR